MTKIELVNIIAQTPGITKVDAQKIIQAFMQISGAQMVIEALIAEEVEVIFGYPGGAIMNVYDAVYQQSSFQHVLTRHEQAAVHAAEGYAKASGKVGVAMITSGPGFTNAITGIADAYMDSVPLVVISGQVPMSLIGTDAFQEIDAVGISRPCTKHNYLVTDAKDLARILKENEELKGLLREAEPFLQDIRNQRGFHAIEAADLHDRIWAALIQAHPVHPRSDAERRDRGLDF